MDITKIKKGDTIIIKPEWMDEGDENIHFIASEDHNGGAGIYMQDADSKFTIIPTHFIRNDMIKEYK